MLSIQPLKSAKAAADYYLSAYNYYAGDATSIKWHGLGAELLNLKGAVEKEQLISLLEGVLPNKQVLKNPKGEHRPGFDMTFSAPKSLSVLVGLGIKELTHLHDKAVAYAIKEIEKEFAEARILKDGEVHFEKTGNLTIAAFRQPSSRANDPSLHTHCVVMNMTFVDGKVRSLASDIYGNNGVVEQLQRNVSYAGLLYRHHLANLLKEEGYKIRYTGKGLFEIDGISEDLLRHFSRRREDIEQYMEEKGWSGAKAASSATVLTREGKEELDLSVLEKEWGKRAEAFNFDARAFVANRLQDDYKPNWLERFKEKILDIFYEPSHRKEQLAQEATEIAIEVLSQKTTVFTERELMSESLKHTLTMQQSIEKTSIEKAIHDLKSKQGLYEGTCPLSRKKMLTTPWGLTLETETIARIEENKGTVSAVALKKEVEALQKSIDKTRSHPLTNSQKQAMLFALTSKDRFIAVQGYAGVAKTTMLSYTCQLMQEKGFEVRGLTVASSAASELSKKAGIEAEVFPLAFQRLKNTRAEGLEKTLYIVDEASMLSSPQGHALCKLIEEKGARLIFVGDEAQLPSVKNGRIFGLIQDYGINTTTMDEIVRQDNQRAKESVMHATKGEIYDALSKISEVREFDSHDKRIHYLASSWLNLSEDVRNRTLLFAPTHANREAITHILREGLQKEGVLTGEEHLQTVLKERPLEEIQKHFSSYYEKDNVIRFNQDFNRVFIKRGEYFTVGDITVHHRKNNVLPLISEDGRNFQFSLRLLPQYKTEKAHFSRILEIYEKKELSLQTGEKILWCRNFSTEGIRNSERATLKEINDTELLFTLNNKEELRLNKNHPALRHLDHGYVFTNYKVQGKDAYYGMGLIESYNKFSATIKNFYVQISRSISQMTVITDDKTALIRALEINDDEKKSAIEALSNEQIKGHAHRFRQSEPALDIRTVVDKHQIKENVLKQSEDLLSAYQNAKKHENKALSSKYAYQILTDKEVLKIARARTPFSYQSYREDALKMATLRLKKELSPEELVFFKAVNDYVKLNKKANLAWKGLSSSGTNQPLRHKKKCINWSNKRDELALFISKNTDSCKPFLKHFSIGELNRSGVPQHKYDAETKLSIKRLEKLSFQASRYQLKEHIDSFFGEATLNEKERLAQLICAESKTAHRFVLEKATALGVDGSALWKDIRLQARSLQDKQFKDTLNPKLHSFFDLAKAYKENAIVVAKSWKILFKAKEEEIEVPDHFVVKIKTLNQYKNELAYRLASKDFDHKPILHYFKIDEVKLARDLSYQEKTVQITIFNKETSNFKKKLEIAKDISEDFKSYYPIIKEQNCDTRKLNAFIKVANRIELLNTLTSAEKEHYIALLNYHSADKKTKSAWKAYFKTKEQQKDTNVPLNQALEYSAKRDWLAFQIKNIDSFGFALTKESTHIEKLQDHSNRHLLRLKEIKELQEERQGILNQCSSSKNNKIEDLCSQLYRLDRQLTYIKNAKSFQYARKDFPIELTLNPKTQIQLTVVSGYKNSKKIKPREYSKLDAAMINESLMANPEATYKAIFGEPKKISGKVMDYTNGLKVTIKGSKAGLWNHFSENIGGAPIQAIMFARGVGFKEALTLASELSGINTRNYPLPVQKQKDKSEETKALAQESALSIWNGTKTIKNTIADTYLKKHRSITNTSHLKDLRFWPVGASWSRLNEEGCLEQKLNTIPALVVAIRDTKNEITGVQRIYLDAKTAGKNSFMDNPKLSCGIVKGGGAIIQSGEKNGVLFLAEGLETGASIALAFPKATVVISFGVNNLGNLMDTVKYQNPKKLIIAGDNDGEKSNSQLTTEKVLKAYKSNHINASIIYPDAINGLKKTDWNDVLIKEGLDSLKKQLSTEKDILNSNSLNLNSRSDLRAPEVKFSPEDKAIKYTNTEYTISRHEQQKSAVNSFISSDNLAQDKNLYVPQKKINLQNIQPHFNINFHENKNAKTLVVLEQKIKEMEI